MSKKILLVEDDRRLAPLVQQFLEDHHFKVRWCCDGKQGWQVFQNERPDLVVLDIMLPGKDGFSFCQELRRHHQTPVLMLTARGDEADRVLGLELGADDYLTKPFGLRELMARIKALLRRSAWTENPENAHGEIRKLGPFQLDLDQRLLLKGTSKIELTRSEFDILDALSSHPGRVWHRNDLLDRIKGGLADTFDRSVDTHISNLRKKIELDPRSPQYILTVWGVGYRLQLS